MAGLRTSWHVNRLHSRARALLTQGKAAETEPLCQEAVALAPQSAKAWLFLGWACLRLNRSVEALEAYDRALSIDPRSDWGWKDKGFALKQLKRYEEALSAFTKSIELNPDHTGGRVGYASTLYDLKYYIDALDICNHIFAMEPDNIGAWRVKSLCLLAERRFDEAIAACEHVLTLPNIEASDYHNTGLALLRAGRYADAARVYTHALSLEPNKLSTLNNFGCVYTHLGYHEQALGMFERVRVIDEQFSVAWVNVGESLVCLSRYDEASVSLTRAAELNALQEPPRYDAYIAAWLGILHTRQGHYEEAMAAFKEALAADPDNNEACMGFAELLLALGESEKAASMIERSLTLNPFDARVWSLKAQILRAAGDEGGADEAEAHGQRMLAEQREQFAAWEREQARA